jgi:hypothetical protein
MGGVGSGQIGWKAKAEHCLSIDVRRWAREGYLAPNRFFRWGWAGAGEKGSTIGVRVGEGRLFLLTHT